MEPVLPLSIVLSLLGGYASASIALQNKFHSLDDKHKKRCDELQSRVDTIELRLAKEYVDKDDLAIILQRLDDRIDRMDYKLDQILIGYNKSAN